MKDKMENIDIGEVEIFGFGKKSSEGERNVVNTKLYICFVIGIDGNYILSITKRIGNLPFLLFGDNFPIFILVNI